MELAICSACCTQQPLALVDGEKVIASHYDQGRYCYGSHKEPGPDQDNR